MELKSYQKKVIADLTRYLELLNETRSDAAAFRLFWQEKSAPALGRYQNVIPGVPNLCFKVSTGGGKTFIACNAVRPIFDALPATKTKAVVWLVPSDAILTQTAKALKDTSHPYRQKIDVDFGGRVEVYTKQELLNGQNFNPTAVTSSCRLWCCPTVYQNGVEVASVTVSKSEDAKLKDLTFKAVEKTGDYAKDEAVTNKIGDGTLVEVFRDDDTNDVTICAISVYAGEISQVKGATSKKDAYVVVDTNKKTEDLLTGSRNEFETEAFAEDDVVAFTFTEKDNEIKTMYKMESVEGELSKRVAAKSVTLGDTTYKYAKEYAFGDDLSEGSLTNKSSYVVYTDANGYVLYVKDAEFAATAYALVEKISGDKGNATSIIGAVNNNQSIWDGNRAKLLFADGSEKTVNLSKDYANEAGDKKVEAGDIVRYSVESDGDYKLTALKDGAQKNSGAKQFYIDNKTLTGLESGIYAGSKTIFVVENGDDFDVYTGIKNAPTVTGKTSGTGATAYAYQSDKAIKVIFVLGAKSVNSSKDVTFIAAAFASKLTTASDTADYYVYNAVVKGEITTVMVNSKTTLTESTKDANGVALTTGGRFISLAAGYSKLDGNIVLNTTTSDSDDIIYAGDFDKTVTTARVHSASKVKKVSTDEIKLGGKALSVASDVKVYLVDSDGNIEAITMSDVKTNDSNNAVYTLEDGEITNLFIIET